MIVRFKSIELRDFKSFVGGHVLNLDLFGYGVQFLRGRNQVEPRLGSNGAGKSTLWDALCWCLYGKTPNGLRNPDIQNRQSRNGAKVNLRLTVDGELLNITRTANPNSLLINGKEAGQDAIDGRLLSFDIFTNTILLGQGRPLFFDLAPREKMALFADVLNLERWDARADSAKLRTDDLLREGATLAANLNLLESQLKDAGNLLERLMRTADEWQQRKDLEASEIAIKLTQLLRDLKVLEDKESHAKLASDGAGMEARALADQIDKVHEHGSKLDQKIVKAQVEYNTVHSKHAALDAELRTLGKGSDRCPTCGQSIRGTALAKHKDKLKAQLQKFAKDEATASTVLKELMQTRSAQDKALAAMRKSETAFRNKETSAKDTLEFLLPELATTKAKIAALNQAARDKRNEPNPYLDQMQEVRQRRSRIEIQRGDTSAKLRTLGEAAERTKYWSTGFKDVRLYIVEELLTELELATNAMLPEMGLVGWRIGYAVEKETKSGTVQRGLNVMVQSPGNKSPVRWESWSGGEGQRLRLVGALALAEVLLARAGVGVDLEVLDEPTQHLSDEGVRDLCDCLAERANKLTRQIWLVDHKAIESAKFASTLTIIKDDQGSYLAND